MRYTTNGIYSEIKNKKLNIVDKYVLSENNEWLLLYGDERSVPKFILIASLDTKYSSNEVTEFEKFNYNLTRNLGYPVFRMRFQNESFEKRILISKNLDIFKKISSNQLYEVLFKQFNIKEAKHHSTKDLNHATANSLQDWQRKRLNAVVVDFDILVVKNGLIAKAIELKRSYIDIESWRPWAIDYPNFYLSIRFLKNIPFFIVYNQRIKSPFRDNVENLSVFKLSINPTSDKLNIENKGIFPFDKVFN